MSGGRLTRVPRSGVLLHRAGNVNQVMKDSAALIERDLVGTDVESTIDRRGVAADDFATEPLRQRDAERALTDRSWPQDGNEPRPMAHGTDSARTNASAASTASSIIKPICCVRFGRVIGGSGRVRVPGVQGVQGFRGSTVHWPAGVSLK